MTWGEKIEKLRKAKGWSIADLSVRSEVKEATIRFIEKNKKNGGNIANFERLLKAMGYKLSILNQNSMEVTDEAIKKKQAKG